MLALLSPTCTLHRGWCALIVHGALKAPDALREHASAAREAGVVARRQFVQEKAVSRAEKVAALAILDVDDPQVAVEIDLRRNRCSTVGGSIHSSLCRRSNRRMPSSLDLGLRRGPNRASRPSSRSRTTKIALARLARRDDAGSRWRWPTGPDGSAPLRKCRREGARHLISTPDRFDTWP